MAMEATSAVEATSLWLLGEFDAALQTLERGETLQRAQDTSPGDPKVCRGQGASLGTPASGCGAPAPPRAPPESGGSGRTAAPPAGATRT